MKNIISSDRIELCKAYVGFYCEKSTENYIDELMDKFETVGALIPKFFAHIRICKKIVRICSNLMFFDLVAMRQINYVIDWILKDVQWLRNTLKLSRSQMKKIRKSPSEVVFDEVNPERVDAEYVIAFKYTLITDMDEMKEKVEQQRTVTSMNMVMMSDDGVDPEWYLVEYMDEWTDPNHILKITPDAVYIRAYDIAKKMMNHTTDISIVD